MYKEVVADMLKIPLSWKNSIAGCPFCPLLPLCTYMGKNYSNVQFYFYLFRYVDVWHDGIVQVSIHVNSWVLQMVYTSLASKTKNGGTYECHIHHGFFLVVQCNLIISLSCVFWASTIDNPLWWKLCLWYGTVLKWDCESRGDSRE